MRQNSLIHSLNLIHVFIVTEFLTFSGQFGDNVAIDVNGKVAKLMFNKISNFYVWKSHTKPKHYLSFIFCAPIINISTST